MAPINQQTGRTIALIGDTGAGKTTLIGEYAKEKFKRGEGRTLLFAGDMGGFDSIMPLVRVGVVQPVKIGPTDDPFLWVANGAKGKSLDGESLLDGIGLVAFDSATNIGELILNWITKLPEQIGQQKTQKFTLSRGKQSLVVGINNEAHYGVVQGFMRDTMWDSTWLTEQGNPGIDLIWTFALDRGEKADDTATLGPKLVGKALTSAIPKWFKYTFRVVSKTTSPGEPPAHLLYIQEQPELGGMGMSFGNSRYPLDATTPLPAVIEPASLVEALRLIEQGQDEAEAALRAELGL